MNDPSLGLELLSSFIQHETKHPHYQRTVDLAKEYRDIFTGTGIVEYLRKYRKNETEQMFNQMLTIYETVIPSVVDNLDTVFEKPLRSNKVYASIETANKTSREEILERVDKFWQGQNESGIDAYLQERWKYDVLYDPNSFIAVLFSEFDSNKEKTFPFAIEYTCHQVYNFNYIKGVLDYLVTEQKIAYQRKVGEGIEWMEGSKFTMYLENDVIVFTEVDKDQKLTDISNPTFVEIMDKDNKVIVRVFVLEIFNTKSKVVPAFRVGYKLDPVTNKQTCLSNIHYALAFFKKELKSGVELDLTIRAHVFPQKYMYGPKCPGDEEHGKTCKSGYDNNGNTCGICKGSGIQPVHTSAQDLVVIPMPTKSSDPIIDLRQAMAYFSPPIELVKFMDEYNERLTEKAKAAVFPSEIIVQRTGGPTTSPTATELDYSWDTRYDALRKFTSKYSYAWKFIHLQIAIYTDNDETLKLFHKFPSDFKMKSAAALLDEGTKAETGNFPQHIKQAIHQDIANLFYADDQDTLTKIETKNKFFPFTGKTPSEISFILASSEILPYYKNLYIYFDVIFSRIDNELGDKFYLLSYALQLDEIKKRVDEITKAADKIKATSFKQAQKEQQEQTQQ